ncbi:MAG: efflux RND transporter periplasmic adaptor subunit [Rhizobiaceae bacterium]|nr:efflux RND transporter periplasmic adaptor subunit [Rhizobiaceae bacterium]
MNNQAPNQRNNSIKEMIENQRAALSGSPGKIAQEQNIKIADNNAGLRLLLQIEAEARMASAIEDLDFIIANEPRKLTRARQIFVFKTARKMRLTAISGLPKIERSAPLASDIETFVDQLGDRFDVHKPCAFSLVGFTLDSGNSLTNYPFPNLLWVPFINRQKELAGGMLLTREQEWPEADIEIARQLAETFQHAKALLIAEGQKTSKLRLSSLMKRKYAVIAAVLCLGALAFPVSMSTLAPFEIKASDSFIVSAPVEGVIDKILVNPGEKIAVGQPIIRFSDIVLHNRLEVSQREVLLAKARLKKASQLAFSDNNERHELRMAMADLALKKSKFNFARAMLDRATIKAQRTGIAVYSDKQELIGKPVSIGERIMQIADPSLIEIEIDVAVNDAILLKPGARVKVFLDSDPVHAHEAKVAFSDYQARVVSGDVLAFRTVARFNKDGTARPRLGGRGTAQIFGDEVPLAFYLFRRPLSALRQWIGL